MEQQESAAVIVARLTVAMHAMLAEVKGMAEDADAVGEAYDVAAQLMDLFTPGSPVGLNTSKDLLGRFMPALTLVGMAKATEVAQTADELLNLTLNFQVGYITGRIETLPAAERKALIAQISHLTDVHEQKKED